MKNVELLKARQHLCQKGARANDSHTHMSKQRSPEHRAQEYWAGRPCKPTSSDLFFDRPAQPHTLFSGTAEQFEFFMG